MFVFILLFMIVLILLTAVLSLNVVTDVQVSVGHSVQMSFHVFCSYVRVRMGGKGKWYSWLN